MSFDPARLKSLFLAAADLPDSRERAAFLDRECADRPDLRARVEALLAADAVAPPDAAAAFGGDTTAPRLAPPAEPRAGAVLGGRYRLTERVGEGGMGSVWVASQTEPVKRKVAVKLIKAGMDSKAVLARFDAERQALAVMDHPHIAKVLDGGVHDGRPYFVMELVKGVPITRFCDERKLTPTQRLELFLPVCQAIQHAHQKGVIHRDIKPSNVLVALYDDRPVVKVIDFGVAKATGASLTEHTLETGFGAVVGTPAYMSPEQASLNNLDVDTRSDVYSLGVLLYELLAGSPPFATAELKKRGLMEMLRVVREEEPPRPSTKLSTADALPSLAASRGTEPKKLTGLLRNELDWVVMKALEKDRTRRYESANGFAADVQRYLSGEPVQAHPPTAAYRLRKFARRHRVQVAAAGLVLLALLLGLAGTTFGLLRADEKRREADQARTDEAAQRKEAEEKEREAREAEGKAVAAQKQARVALDSADQLLRIQERFRPHGWERYTDDQLATLNGLADQFERGIRTGGKPEAAEAYSRLATVQFLLDKPAEQGKSLQTAIALWTELLRIDPTNAAEYTVQIARTRARLVPHFTTNYHPSELNPSPLQDPKYIALLRQVAADWKAAVQADPMNASAMTEHALALQNVAASLPNSLKNPVILPPEVQAEQNEMYREAVGHLERAVALQPDDRPLRQRLQDAYRYAELPTEAVRAALATAARFPDERVPRRWRVEDNTTLFTRDEYTWDSELFLLLQPRQDRGLFPSAWHGRPCEAEALANVERARRVLREFPGYKYASGVELMLLIAEARAIGAVWWSTNKLDERPPPLTADQRRRRDGLYAKALALARDPATKLPTPFLKLVPFEKNLNPNYPHPPKKLAPLTAEEYVWMTRMGTGWATDEDAAAEVTAELGRRKDWRPTAMFHYFLTYHLLPEDVAFNATTPKVRLIDGWLKADAAFARFRESVARDDDGYRIAAFNFSRVALNCASRFRQLGEPVYTKQALDRTIQLLDDSPPRIDIFDSPYRARCYFDRADWYLNAGEWAAALADYKTCLKHSDVKPDEAEPTGVPYMTGRGYTPGINAFAHFRSGIALLRLNRLAEAEAAFDEALNYRRAEKWNSRMLTSGKPSVPWTVATTEHDRANQYLETGRWKQAAEWAERGLKTLDENAEAYPIGQVSRLRYSLRGIRARAFGGQNDPAAAVAEWEAARQWATAEDLRTFAVLSAEAYAKAGRHAEAAARLDELAKTDRLSIEELYNLACGYSLCSAGAKVEQEQADRYREQAMRHLKRAVDAGYADARHMKQDSDLDPIRERDDFKTLLAELEKKAGPKK